MDPAIARELAELREEIEALRAAAPQAAAAPEDASAASSDPIKAVIGTLHSLLEATEASVVAHPLAGAAGAFLLGLLVGRATKSR